MVNCWYIWVLPSLTDKIKQVVGQYVEQKEEESNPSNPPATELGGEAVTIGEALEAAARCAGDQPIDMADAAAIEAAEKRALGTDVPSTGSLASEAHLAAAWNAQTNEEELMTTIDDVLKVNISIEFKLT